MTRGPDRYVVLVQGAPVYTSACRSDVLLYLWRHRPAMAPDAPFDYVVLDNAGHHPVTDFTSLNAWLVQGTEDAEEDEAHAE